MSRHALAHSPGLGAALVGVLCGFHGWWAETIACGVVVIVCSVLTAVWETE